MKTREDYMTGKCSHREYYEQFVTEAIKLDVASSIGVKRIQRSTDEHLNDIPLSVWDNIGLPHGRSIGSAMRAAGDLPSLAGLVCVAKAAARMLVEEKVTR